MSIRGIFALLYLFFIIAGFFWYGFPVENGVEGGLGFLAGFWHGAFAGINLLCQLFGMDTSIYAVGNSGGWYDLGFLMGIGGISGLLGSSSSS